MFESNDIDIFLKREELLNTFYELTNQIESQPKFENILFNICLLYTSPSPRDY